jgi:hydroxymethylpyrimidine pyrophosphatase-like HAD family hydrolase
MIDPVYIFDVDGVINNITTYEPDIRVIKQIASLLNNGLYVAINTGRGYPWVKKNILEEMRKDITTEMLEHVFVSAEMGGVTVEFRDGNELDVRTAFSLQPEQIEQVKQIYDAFRQSDTVSWYDGKISMATIYKPAGVDSAAFLSEADEIKGSLLEIFAGKHVKINVNPDAIDVTTPEAGKWAGAQLIQDWLRRTPAADSTNYICFGDNSSDYEMARFFGQQGHKVEFVFTGKELGDIEHDPQVALTMTESHYNEGTYSFLKETGKQ